VTTDDVLRVTSAFGLPVAQARVFALLGGYLNDTWHVVGPTLDVVVRRYGRTHVARSSVLFEHALSTHVAQRLRAVVAPLRTPDGTTLVTENGAFFAIFPWIPGESGHRDLATGCAAAGLLAQYHLAVCDFELPSGARATRFLGELPWLNAEFQTFARPESPLARALPWNELILAIGATTLRVARCRRNLPALVVHGDPHPGNVVVADGSVRGLIDFDFAHESERLTDLGALLDEFARADDDAPLQVERIGPLIAAYDAIVPLTDDERELVGEAMLRHAAALTRYVVGRHHRQSPGAIGGAARYARRVLEISAALEGIRDAS